MENIILIIHFIIAILIIGFVLISKAKVPRQALLLGQARPRPFLVVVGVGIFSAKSQLY